MGDDMPPADDDGSLAWDRRQRNESQWEVVARQGVAIGHIKEIQADMREEMRDHQKGEELYREKDREAKDLLSQRIATNTEAIKQRMDDFRDSVTSEIGVLRETVDKKLSDIVKEIAIEAQTRKDLSAQAKGGWKVLTWLGAAVTFLAGIAAWVLSSFPKPPQ